MTRREVLPPKGRALNSHLLQILKGSWSPGTVMGRYNKYADCGEIHQHRTGQKKRGRPAVTTELEEAIVKIAKNNPHWGYKRIRDYLIYLGFTVCFTTVKRVIGKHGFFAPPDGRNNSDFNLFFESHQNVITSCDFCTREVVTPNGLDRHMILFFENIFTREVWLGGIEQVPDGNRMAQIARNQTDAWDGTLKDIEYLIHDHDPLFQGRFTEILASAGCKTKMTQPRCPEQNGHIESFIKSFKTECLDHLILTSERQLRYVVKEYLQYYNRECPHSGLDGKWNFFKRLANDSTKP